LRQICHFFGQILPLSRKKSLLKHFFLFGENSSILELNSSIWNILTQIFARKNGTTIETNYFNYFARNFLNPLNRPK
jgi:hypothetical protein